MLKAISANKTESEGVGAIGSESREDSEEGEQNGAVSSGFTESILINS